MVLSAADYQAKIDKLELNMDRMNSIVNGTVLTEVTIDSGTVPSIARFFATFANVGWISYATRADLFADLNWNAGTEGRVYGDSNLSYRGVYKKVGAPSTGSWTYIGPLPIADTTYILNELGLDYGEYSGWSLVNYSEAGKAIGGFRISGRFAAKGFELPNKETITEDAAYWDWVVTGATDKPIYGIRNGRFIAGAAGRSDDLATLPRESALLARSASMKKPSNARFTRPFWEWNMLLHYGQSLSTGQQSIAPWVATETATRDDCFMIGNSVRPQQDQTINWEPHGGAYNLVPLRPTVESGTNQIYTEAEVIALPSDSQALGYNPAVGSTQYIARAFEDHHLNQRQWVAVSTGSGGKSIEQLTAGAGTNYFNRLLQGIQAFNNATPYNESKGVAAVVFMQGEYNYSTDIVGANDTKAFYKTRLVEVKTSINNTINNIKPQPRNPAMLIYQTGAGYTYDHRQLAIGMAQWELSLENKDIIMVGPVYPVTDMDGHLSANGSKWYSQQIGKVFHKVVTLGQGWEPLSPLSVTTIGKTVYIGYHVPEPPIKFDLPYVINTATDYRDKGFKVQDVNGVIPLDSVRIINSCTIALDMSRAPDMATAFVWYAAKETFNGNGCVRDSDDTMADADYVGSDIAALTGKPYPLHNWSIAFYLPINNWTRI